MEFSGFYRNLVDQTWGNAEYMYFPAFVTSFAFSMSEFLMSDIAQILSWIFCSCDILKKNVDSKWLEDIRPVIQRGPGRGPTPTQLHPRVLPVYWFHYLPCRRHHHGNLLTSLIVIIIIIIIITIITSAQRVPKPDPLASFYFNTRPDSGIRLP